MSSLPRAHGKGTKTDEYVVLVRKNATSDGTMYVGNGYIVCASCGGPTLSKGELEAWWGIPKGSLTKFLNRLTVRADVAATIRSKVKQVVE